MNLKNLPISLQTVRAKLQEFADGQTFAESIKGTAIHCTFIKDGKSALLIVHEINGGGITLQPSGKESKLAVQGAEYIAACAASPQAQFNVSVRKYTKERFDLLISYLKESCKAESDGEPKVNDSKTMLKLKGPHGDVLTFTFFKNGTLTVQGRPIALAFELAQYLAEDENITQAEMMQHLGDMLPTDSEGTGIEDQLRQEYPHTEAFAGTNMKKLLCTALAMHSVDLPDGSDYSVVSMPALRAMEHFMKKIVYHKCQEHLTDLSIFTKSKPQAILDGWRKKISCPTTCRALEACYPHYKTHRHGTFHADGLDGGIRIIEKKIEAVTISNQTMKLIETHCKALAEK